MQFKIQQTLRRTASLFHRVLAQKAPKFMTIHIKESNTDPFRLGHTLTVGATNSIVCPVQALEKYISLCPPAIGPLFINASGKPLTKQALTAETRNLLSLSCFNAANFISLTSILTW